MKQLILIFLVVAMLISCQSSDSGAGRAESPQAAKSLAGGCENIQLSSSVFTYCVQDPGGQQFDSSRILYVLHGIQGTPDLVLENFFVRIGQSLRQIKKERAPQIVGITIGPEGIFKNNTAEILQKGILELEKRIAPAGVSERHLLGFSMGSHNSARLVAQSPQSFQSVALICPALFAIDPFDLAAMNAYEQRHASYLDRNLYQYALGVFKREFASSSEWAKQNPFEFIQSGAFNNKNIFISVGLQDSLGFHEGARRFYEKVNLTNPAIIWSPVQGGHCQMNWSELVQFLNSQF